MRRPLLGQHRLDRDGDEGQVHQHERHGRAERPVVGALELALDDVGDHLAVGTAQQVGRQIGPQRRDEGDQDPRGDARQGQGHDHLEQGPHMPGAEVEAGLQQRLVQPVQRRIQRQHHERQVDVDQAHDHREIVVQHLQRLEVGGCSPTSAARPFHSLQALVDVALGAQHGDQGVGADQQVRPERQHDQQQQPGLGLVGGEGDGQGHREADHQAQAVVRAATQADFRKIFRYSGSIARA
jgi:hypothetical protein